MSKYQLTHLAIQDLSDIWNYTFENWSEQRADIYYDQLVNAFESIIINPDHGRSYDGIRNGLRGLKINRHIVFYRIISSELIEITRILNERMDLKNQLK
ncbi:MAG: type II toxin-antitoxin system RelE/ParE family toxin [Bacteroidota bacterium]